MTLDDNNTKSDSTRQNFVLEAKHVNYWALPKWPSDVVIMQEIPVFFFGRSRVAEGHFEQVVVDGAPLEVDQVKNSDAWVVILLYVELP